MLLTEGADDIRLLIVLASSGALIRCSWPIRDPYLAVRARDLHRGTRIFMLALAGLNFIDVDQMKTRDFETAGSGRVPALYPHKSR
jgi:hypothetical protein